MPPLSQDNGTQLQATESLGVWIPAPRANQTPGSMGLRTCAWKQFSEGAGREAPTQWRRKLEFRGKAARIWDRGPVKRELHSSQDLPGVLLGLGSNTNLQVWVEPHAHHMSDF